MVQEQAAGILLILLATGLRSRAFFGVVKNSHSQRAFLGTLASCRLDLLLSYSHLTFTRTMFMLIERDAVLYIYWFQAAKQARYDKEALIKFFRMVCTDEFHWFIFSAPWISRLMLLNQTFQLIRRRYFSNEPPAPNPWSLTPREDTILPVETLGDSTDSFQRKRWACLTWKRPLERKLEWTK